MRRPILLLGAGGNLGAALHRRLLADGHAVATLSWAELKRTSVEDLRRLPLVDDSGGDVVFANGLTDATAPAPALDEGNVAAPRRLIEATCGNPAIRYLTIGTVMEHEARMVGTNAYVASKTRLADELRAVLPAERHLHVRLHTLYGGRPVPHMFLGQLIAALAQGRRFRMSAGTQWREYHHVDDIAGTLARLLATAWNTPDGLDIGSGRAIRLRDLAEAAFARFSTLERLEIGALPSPEAENGRQSLPPSPDAVLGPSRPALAGVLAWIEAVLNAS